MYRVKARAGKVAACLVFILNQQCLVKDHQEFGAAEGTKMLTCPLMSSPNTCCVCYCATVLERIIAPIRGYFNALWFFGDGGR